MNALLWIVLHTLSLSAHFVSSFSALPLISGRGGKIQSVPNEKRRELRPLSSSTSDNDTSNAALLGQKLSVDCVSAITIAQDLGHSLGQTTLKNELLLVGVVSQPERAGATFLQYGFTTENVQTAATKALGAKSTTSSTTGESKSALPFSRETQRLLDQAMAIADYLGSPTINSEHMTLALMGYNYGKLIEDAPVFPVLSQTTGLSRGFRCFQFCQDLVQSLDALGPSESTTFVTQTVGVGSSSTNQQATGATLQQVGVDLTQRALDGQLDVVYGRNDEITAALRTLGRRRKNNPCLIGEPGVGKTAIAEGVAQVLATALEAPDKKKGGLQLPRLSNPFGRKKEEASSESDITAEPYELPKCPNKLAGARLISIDLASLVAGTANRGDFEKRVQNLINEASVSNVILFIDELHNIVGTGGEGAMNAANLLKPALSRGELRLLGATTTPEYRKYIEKDGALERRFQPLQVEEPTVEETIRILAATIAKYEAFHGVEYTDNALVSAARLSDRYVADRFLPDKAIDVLDEAGSMIMMRSGEEEDGSSLEEDYFVTEDAVNEIIADITGIPVGRLDTGEKERLRDLENLIGQRIKGQDPAVGSVAKSIRRARSGMRDPRRPVSSFLFCGPTGVGKTEVCKALADSYFGREKDMIRIDMSEYMDRFSVSRLVGAPPGYVGYEEGGQLTEAVRRKPHAVVLFDEVEKAHEDVLNLLLQVLDDGQLTDGKGRRVDFSNTIIVMTSNVGSQRIIEISRDPNAADDATSAAVKSELEKTMKPELLNRIDETIIFSPLSYDNLKDIANNIIEETRTRAATENGISVAVSDSISEAVTREGSTVSSQYGARPIRRGVQRYLEDPLSEAIIQDFIKEGDEVKVGLDKPDGDTTIVKVTKGFSNGSSFGESMKIPVDSTVELSMDYLTYGDIPSLDDDDDEPRRETDTFQ